MGEKPLNESTLSGQAGATAESEASSGKALAIAAIEALESSRHSVGSCITSLEIVYKNLGEVASSLRWALDDLP